MKKLILMSMILSAALFATAQMVFTNQSITVMPSQLSVESVSFQPLEIVTNTVFQWLESVEITTNELHAGLRDFVVTTNTVNRQVISEVVSTNAAGWTVHVIFALPSGHRWELNRFPVTIERFKTRLEIPVTRAAVQGLFGPAAAGLEFAAQNGAYQPTGQVKNGFLSLAASVLAGGQQ